MARYFVRTKAAEPRSYEDWWDQGPLLPPISVTDHEAVDTGLIDAHGDPIMRAPNPIGFGRADEW